MKFFFIISLLLFSCSAQRHLELSEKHKQKAIKKGAIITVKTDTVEVTKYSKVYDTITKDSIQQIYTTQIIEKSGELRYVTKWDKRKERRLEKLLEKYRFKLSKDSLAFITYKAKQENRTARTVVRQENKKENWWIWLIIGLVVGFILRTLLKIYLRI